MSALIDPPTSTDSQTITPLASIDAYDAVLNDDYAFVAYKETDRSSGAWRVRISGRRTPGSVFEPEAMRLSARSAHAQGKPYFTWGWGMEPSAGDPRMVQFRVHVADGRPSAIEMVIQLRNADGSAAAPRTVTFAWPA